MVYGFRLASTAGGGGGSTLVVWCTSAVRVGIGSSLQLWRSGQLQCLAFRVVVVQVRSTISQQSHVASYMSVSDRYPFLARSISTYQHCPVLTSPTRAARLPGTFIRSICHCILSRLRHVGTTNSRHASSHVDSANDNTTIDRPGHPKACYVRYISTKYLLHRQPPLILDQNTLLARSRLAPMPRPCGLILSPKVCRSP